MMGMEGSGIGMVRYWHDSGIGMTIVEDSGIGMVRYWHGSGIGMTVVLS